MSQQAWRVRLTPSRWGSDMARYQKRIDVWQLSPEERGALQPGQHIIAGGSHGVYLGKTRGGSDVAMWEGNAKGRNRRDYMAYLRRYALAG